MRKHSVVTLCVLLYTINTFAGDFKSGGSVIIDQPQHGDLYITAGTIIINAPVYGDVIITGGNVTINDSITEDVMVAGGQVLLNGYVGDDVRCAGGKLTVTSVVKGDLILAGGLIDIQQNASASSIAVTGGKVIMSGTSLHSIKVAAGEFTLNGTVGNNAEIKGGTLIINGKVNGKASLAASEDIKISETAHIGRGIQYWLPFKRPLVIPAGVAAGAPTYNELLSITHSKWYFLGASTFLGLMWYLGMAFILILLLQYFFSATFYRSGIKLHARPVRSLLFGLGYFICVPIAAVLLLVTIVGLPLSLIITFAYVTSILLATIISSVVIVNWITFLSDREYSLIKMSGMALVAFALLKIVTFTPFFGGFLMMLIGITCFGALIGSIRWKAINTGTRQTRERRVSLT